MGHCGSMVDETTDNSQRYLGKFLVRTSDKWRVGRVYEHKDMSEPCCSDLS